MPPVRELVAALGLELPRLPSGERVTVVEPVEAWSLPFFLDGLLQRWNGPELLSEWRFSFQIYFDLPNRRGPSAFAQHLTFAPVVPVESSPLGAKSLSELIAGGGVSAALGYLTGHPLLVVEVGGGIILCGAARGVADALRIGLRSKLLGLMGVADQESEPPPDE